MVITFIVQDDEHNMRHDNHNISWVWSLFGWRSQVWFAFPPKKQINENKFDRNTFGLTILHPKSKQNYLTTAVVWSFVISMKAAAISWGLLNPPLLEGKLIDSSGHIRIASRKRKKGWVWTFWLRNIRHKRRWWYLFLWTHLKHQKFLHSARRPSLWRHQKGSRDVPHNYAWSQNHQ